MNNNSQKILQTILNKYRPIKIKQAIYSVGAIALCKDDEGIRGLRTVIDSYRQDTNWESVKREIGKVKEKVLSENWKNYHGFIKDIEKNIKEFKPFKLSKAE